MMASSVRTGGGGEGTDLPEVAVLEAAVFCSSGSLSCSVAADGVKADLADNIVLLVE